MCEEMANKSDGKIKNPEVYKKIYDNYNHMNQMMVEVMDIVSKHDGITGNYREEMWMKFFRSIIPQKFSMAQGVMIIDSKGNVSREVDIAVFDEQYTPYVFQYNTLKFIPIEAVAIVIECKSTDLKPEILNQWAKSINKLKSKRSGIARIVTGYASGLTNLTQSSTRPIKILACIKSNKKDSTLYDTKKKYGKYFDFIIQEKDKGVNEEENKNLEVLVNNEDKTLGWWGDELNNSNTNSENKNLELNHITNYKGNWSKSELEKEYPELKFNDDLYLTNTLEGLRIPNNPLLTLNLQLNQLIMLINNPMYFPHYAYAERFKDIEEKINKKEAKEKTTKNS